MGLDEWDLFGFAVKIDFPELEGLITWGRNQEIAIGTEFKVMNLILKISKKNYFVTSESVWGDLTIDVPEEDDIIHARWGNVLARGVEIEAHDGLLMAFEGSDEAGVLLSLHFGNGFEILSL